MKTAADTLRSDLERARRMETDALKVRAAAVQRAREAGLTVAAIAEIMGAKTRKSVYDLLERAGKPLNAS